eukprot:3621665-Rhodomonas_salina.1
MPRAHPGSHTDVTFGPDPIAPPPLPSVSITHVGASRYALYRTGVTVNSTTCRPSSSTGVCSGSTMSVMKLLSTRGWPVGYDSPATTTVELTMVKLATLPKFRRYACDETTIEPDAGYHNDIEVAFPTRARVDVRLKASRAARSVSARRVATTAYSVSDVASTIRRSTPKSDAIPDRTPLASNVPLTVTERYDSETTRVKLRTAETLRPPRSVPPSSMRVTLTSTRPLKPLRRVKERVPLTSM